MATWAQRQGFVIDRTNEGKISWEEIVSPSGITYYAEYKGIKILVRPNLVKLKYRNRSKIKEANMTTLRNAIAAFLADNGEAADLDIIDALLSS